MPRDPFDLHPYIHGIWLQTKNDASIEKERNFIDGFFDNQVDEFIHPYGDSLLDKNKLDNSLFYYYLAGQASNFHWYGHSLFCGAYTVLFREFRCILEGLFIVYKIEKMNIGKTTEEKLDILKDAENDRAFYGGGLFKSSGLDNWQKYHTIYKKLSGFIHFSYTNTADVIQKIKTRGFPEVLNYTYDKEKFLHAYSTWQQMAFLAVDMAADLATLDNIELSISTKVFEL